MTLLSTYHRKKGAEIKIAIAQVLAEPIAIDVAHSKTEFHTSLVMSGT